MNRNIVLTLLMIAALPGCRSRHKPVAAPPSATNTAPAATRVAPPSADFASSTASPEPAFPADVAELNRVARERGWIADAFFDYDRTALRPDAQEALRRSAQWLREHRDLGVTLEGHCDERGTEQYNLALGARRAQIAKEYLGALGIDGDRLQTVSYGEERPLVEGHSEEAWSQNRRAHFVLRPKS